MSFATAKKIFTRINRHPAGVKKGNPEYKQDFIDNDSNFPMSHYGHISEPTVPSVEIPRFIDPYELKGSVLTPLYGDHTDAGRRLKSILIGDLQFDLDRPVELMGGPRFGLFQRYNEDPNAIWASDKGAVSKYAAGWKGLSEKYGGADVLPVFTGQGRKAQQSNTMFADVLSQMLNSSPLTRASQKLFDEKAGRIIPDFVGMRSEKLFDQLRNLSFDKRGEFMKNFVSSKPIQQGGFPDMVAIGNALTDPGVHPDARMAGYVISKANLDDLVNRSPLFPHPSYKNNLHGEVLGGFREQIPAKLMWRPAYEARMPQAEPKYLETNGPYIGRYMDDEAIDEISQHLEDAAAARKLGGYAEGGLYTDEELARRDEEQMGGVTPDGYASSLPPTLSMQFGDLVSPYLDAAYDLFPKENPRGKFLRDMIMGDAPEAARRMAEGEPYVLANTRSRNPLDWKINSEALDMAGALPVATATGALGKIAGTVKASAPFLGGLGIIKQKGGNWVPPVLDKIVPAGANDHTIPSTIGLELERAPYRAREDYDNQNDLASPWRGGPLGTPNYQPLEDGRYQARKPSDDPKRSASRLLSLYEMEDPESILNNVRFAIENQTQSDGGEFAKEFLYLHEDPLEEKKAVNIWLQKQLTRYLQNDMGTAEDPVRAMIERRSDKFAKSRDVALREAEKQLAHAEKLRAEGPRPGMPEGTWLDAIIGAEERARQIKSDAEDNYRIAMEHGIMHFPRDDQFLGSRTESEDLAKINRRKAGFPLEGAAISEPAKDWEDLTDSIIGRSKKKSIVNTVAGDKKDLRMEPLGFPAWGPARREQTPYINQLLRENPWIHNLDDETPFNYLGFGTDALKLSSLKNKIKTMLDDKYYDTDGFATLNTPLNLPPHLRLKYSDLPNLSTDAAIEKAADLQLYQRMQMIEDQKKRLKSPVLETVKSYPDTDHSWVQIRNPRIEALEGSNLSPEELSAQVASNRANHKRDLENELAYEGSQMRHCVGNYCEPVSTGATQIFSLRDKHGTPHTTIEVRPPTSDEWNNYWDNLPNRGEVLGSSSPLHQNPALYTYNDEDLYKEAAKFFSLPTPPLSTVIQIKGKGNHSPPAHYYPMIKDFLSSKAPWRDINDDANAGLSSDEYNALLGNNFSNRAQELTDEFEVNELDLENLNLEGGNFVNDPPDIELDDPEEFAQGGLVDGDRNRLNSIISDFLSDNPGQYAEVGEPQQTRRMVRQERQRRPEFQLDLGLAPTDSNNGLGGGGHAGMRLPIGPATLSVDAVGGGGYGQQVNPEGYLGYGPRGPVMRVGKPKFGGGASLAGIQAQLEGLPGLAGRYGISYDTQPFMLTQTLGLDERGMPRATRGSLIGGEGMGNNQRIWDRMLPDEKVMFTYNREF